MGLHGPRYAHILVPCPLGWGAEPKDTIRLARLAKETGLFPVFEAVDGGVVGVSAIRRQVPVTEYLRPQRRFAHLFRDPPATEELDRLQALCDRNIRRFGLLGDGTEARDVVDMFLTTPTREPRYLRRLLKVRRLEEGF